MSDDTGVDHAEQTDRRMKREKQSAIDLMTQALDQRKK
jgi:hypothetical protein